MIEQLEVEAIAVMLVEGIKTHSRREHEKGGYEAVGFLARKEGTSLITSRVALANHNSNPQQGFFVEPWEQFRAEQKLENAGYEIVGVYHSHPVSEALPSRTDEQMARAGELMLIYSVAFDELRAWRECGGSLVPVRLELFDG